MTNKVKSDFFTIQRILFLIDKITAVFFDYFGIENTPQEIINKIKKKSISHNIFRIQSDCSVIRGFYCIAFIKYMKKFIRL